MQNNSIAAPFIMLATSRSCRNIHCFDPNNQPGKITLQVLVLCLLDKVKCAVFWVFEKWYAYVLKRLCHLKRGLLILIKKNSN